MKKIETISRVLIISDGRFLVCKDKLNENYFLPGGHVEFGEFSNEAVVRELNEELSLNIYNFYLIGIVENIYFAHKKNKHEINLVYFAETKDISIESKEDHIEFFLFSKKDFEKKDIRPKDLKKAILCWQENRKFFNITTKD